MISNVLETKYIPLVRTYLVKERFVPYGSEQLCKPELVAKMAERILKNSDREHLLVVSLDTKSKPVAVEIVSIGTINSTIAVPREIYKHSITSNAASIVLVHNHPSGDPTPSESDVLLTKRMKRAGEILGIELLDHVILGDEGCFVSLQEEGVIQNNI